MAGLWFGLFEDPANEFVLYVRGTPDFVPSDGGDLACDYVWLPHGGYLRTRRLSGEAGWQHALESAVRLVEAAQPWTLVPPTVRGAAVGFDDGDVEVVWSR